MSLHESGVDAHAPIARTARPITDIPPVIVDATCLAGARTMAVSDTRMRAPSENITTEWLGLIATPAFALMALVTGFAGEGADVLCLSGHGYWLQSMMPMYLLMSAVHVAPWLTLVRNAHRGWRVKS